MHLPYLNMLLLLLTMFFCNKALTSEVKNGANIYTPFKHKKFYRGEREQLGYKPEYPTNLISFDQTNTPYIRDGYGFVNTLNKNGRWIKIDFKPAIKAMYPQWGGSFFKGPFAEERIIFDSNGGAYMHVLISRKSPQAKSLLLYSRDNCRTWQVFPLPAKFHRHWYVKLENSSPSRRLPTPPVLSIFNGKYFYILIAKKNKTGLCFDKPVLVAHPAAVVPPHSGGGNFTATTDGKTYIVYAGLIQKPGHIGTPQYITVYDHTSKRCIAPIYIQNNGNSKRPDNHNLPTVLIDSKGYIHVLLGSHHDPFIYLRSKKPYNISSWTKPEILAYTKTKMAEGSYTYIGILCDRFDNLHLTARWAGDGYKNYLIYMKKPVNRDWLPQQVLVEPFKTLYSCYYHKMSQDLYGRIFVNYSYYGKELHYDEAVAYDKKWPEHKLLDKEANRAPNGFSYSRLRANDPVTIISNDSGDTFRLALTSDFRAGRLSMPNPGKVTVNSIGMPLVKIPAKEFIIGSLNGAKDEKPLRPVKVNKSFLLGKYPVRVKDFAAFIKATAYVTEFERTKDKRTIHSWCGGKFLRGDDRNWHNPKIPQTLDNPVVMLTINDIKAFCQWLSKKEHCVYRLPTEAEWEYACRAGSITNYYFGDNKRILPRYGWYKANATGTKPVGMLLPNAFGLHDMIGNVWEYCADYYTPKRSDLPATDPLFINNKIFGPVIRGGSWIDDWYGNDNGFNLRSASRYHIVYPLIQLDWVGFRILKELK